MRTFDYSQLQSRQWDSEILGLVAQIHEFKGRQELYLKQKPAVLDKLIDIAKVQSTEASKEIDWLDSVYYVYRFILVCGGIVFMPCRQHRAHYVLGVYCWQFALLCGGYCFSLCA